MATDGGGGSTNGGSTGEVAGGVRWVGRVDATNQAAIKFNWGGTGFVANVAATGATVAVTINNDGPIFFQPVVDGVMGIRVKAAAGMSSVPLATNLVAGMHLVEFYRETEASSGGVSTFLGISGATLMAPPTYSGRLIEVIGDSTSNGYGELGSETHPNSCSATVNGCGYTIDTQSAYQNYGATAARLLSADWSIIANSGWGLSRDLLNGLQNVMPNVYDDAYFTSGAPPKWAFNIRAQAVIINLGTNDLTTGDPGVAYKDALKKFVGQIRAKHGAAAWIFPVTGPLLAGSSIAILAGYINAAITELGDPKVLYINFGTQDACNMPTGCQWHPSVAEHRRLANILVPILKARLGW